MKMTGLALLLALLAGCDLLPQKPLTDKEVASTDTTKLCQWSGYYFGQGSIREFQIVRAELARRNALTPECVSIAQMQIAADARAQEKRQAYAQALGNIGRDLSNQPKPVVCQSSQTSATTASTNCQ